MGRYSQAWLLSLVVTSYTVMELVGATILQGELLLQVARDWNLSNVDGPAYNKYYSTWVVGTDPCVANWAGTNCNDGIEVTTLNLTSGGLLGPVPQAMSALTSLMVLDLSNGAERFDRNTTNFISGDLAPLGSLTNLTYLAVGKNNLGLNTFPQAILKLTNLQSLYVDNTLINGKFPDLRNLTKLEVLFMGNNSFEHPFPITVTQMVSLKVLTLWGSTYADFLPKELGNLVNLTYFNCNRCGLFGGLPPELGKLKKMQRFHLYKNSMTGPIPVEYLAWESLSELRLEVNSFYSNFSQEFFKLANLSKLTLNNLQLVGTLPNNLTTSAIPNLKSLSLSCNYFTGLYPTLTDSVAGGDVAEFGQIKYNCLEGAPEADVGGDTNCERVLSCPQFLTATAGGKCPRCPNKQIIMNSTTCVCQPGSDSGSKSWVAPVAGVSSALGILLGAVIVFGILTKCFQHKPFDKTRDIFGKKKHEEYYDPNWKVPAGVKRFTLEELSQMTGDFDESRVVGQGGFGKVYKGTLSDGKNVAIKRSSNSSAEGSQGMQEFRNEVDLLSRLHHKNLVTLVGFCDESEMQILVYEYMSHGNLHMLLFRDDLTQYMDWYKRLEIAVETAQGLEYLHHHADPPVIHRDVKPGNILLDEYFKAKVADFGISRESAEFETHVTTKLAGTAGYFDPQYFLNRQLTKASDVYSYGICLLELVTGQKAIDHMSRGKEVNLLEWAKPRLNKLGLVAIVDPRLKGNYPPGIFLDMANLAIMCSLFDKNERPTMREVVAALEPQLKAATRPPQWQLPLKPIPEFPPAKEDGSTTTEWSNVSNDPLLGKKSHQDEACTSSTMTTIYVEPR